MLTLQLTLTDQQVNVYVNGKESHRFSLRDLRQSKEEFENFLDNPRVYGEKLFSALFKNAARMEFDALSKQIERTIVLVLESSELDVVAWEYAYNKEKEEYVVEDCAFVRALPENERPANGRLKASYERVSLLFIPANPLVNLSGEPMPALDEESEWKELSSHITASRAGFDLLKMLPATAQQLQTVMARFHSGLIIHFSGHGDVKDGKAILLFEEENGASNPLDAREFVREVKDKSAITFLSSCRSAAAERTEFSNLARELVKAGVPFALGMQFNLPDPFAPDISGQFYNYLTRGHTVPEAARQARRAVKRKHEFFVGMIALYASHPNEAGALTWSGAGAQILSLFRPADVSALPFPASGLIGRQRELMSIGTQLLERKKPLTVTLHGAGGIGKTALLGQALLRFAPSFELTLAIVLDPLPSLESVLGRIERFLGLPVPCANDTQERAALVQNALTGKRVLLGLDNFETLNYALNEKNCDEEKTAKRLHTFFKSIGASGVTLCVTSREVTNLGGETIEDIQGLTNENGGKLFQENVVAPKQKRQIYIEKTQQISEIVGGHPLALRLLASVFNDQDGTSLDQYIESLKSFLPTARDQWTEEDRHESLRASFDFTMTNLLKTSEGEELKVALSRLSVFVAYFDEFSTGPILKNKWYENKEEIDSVIEYAKNTLYLLWERGLLERQILQLPDDNLYRLHPALSQFAAECLKPEDLLITQEMHWRAMCQLAYQANPASEGIGIFNNLLMSTAVRAAMPDMLKATKFNQSNETAALLFHLAFLYSHFGDLDEALKLYQESLKIHEELGDLKGKPAILHQIAYILRVRGDLEGATKLYQQNLEVCEALGDLHGKSAALNDMAYIHRLRGDLDGAMKLYEQSLAIHEELGDLQSKSVTLGMIANLYRARGQDNDALKLYSQSLEISEELGDLKTTAVALGSMASICRARGDLDGALILCQRSYELSTKLGDRRSESSTLHEMANINFLRGNLDEAMSLYQQSLEIDEKLDDRRGKSVILNGIAGIHSERGNWNDAIKLHQQALEIQEELGELQGQASTLGEMARIEEARGNLDTAMQMLEQRLAIATRVGDQHQISLALLQLADIHLRCGNVDRALRMCQQSLAISERVGNLQGQLVALHQVADIYILRGDVDTGMKLYQESIEIFEKLGNLQGKSSTLKKMADIARTRRDFDGAIDFYQQSLQIDEGLGDLVGKSAILHNMGVTYGARGDLEEAMKLYQQSLEITEGRGDLKTKGATLQEMAYVLRVRGDLEGAMRLYQQSLNIFEKLGDMEGKAQALHNVAPVLFEINCYAESLKSLLSALEIRIELQSKSDLQSTVSSLKDLRNAIGINVFQKLWQEVTGSEQIPEWLHHFPKPEECKSVNLFIASAIQSSREKRPEAWHYFIAVQKMAVDPELSAEFCELGKVLSRIMVGDKTVDLSGLPEEMAEAVRKELLS